MKKYYLILLFPYFFMPCFSFCAESTDGMKLIPAKGKSINLNISTSRNGPLCSFTYNFWMDSIPVSELLYRQVMDTSYPNVLGDNYPVNNLSFYQAVLYCNKKSKKYGLDTVYSYYKCDTSKNTIWLYFLRANYKKHGFRLPTRAERTFAHQGGTSTFYYWGDSCDLSFVPAAIVKVTTYPPNPYGLYNMNGPHLEWLNDWDGPGISKDVSLVNYMGIPEGIEKQYFGGRRKDTLKCEEIQSRYFHYANPTGCMAGMRMVLVLEDPDYSTVDTSTLGPFGRMKQIPSKGKAFVMGSESSVLSIDSTASNELPAHVISFDYNFEIDSTEVTIGRYFEVMRRWNPSGSSNIHVSGTLPAQVITWYSAVDYCNELSRLCGLELCHKYDSTLKQFIMDSLKNGFRLPTEAEWEYSCRSGSKTLYYWGDIFDTAYCVGFRPFNTYFDNVASKKPNAFGLYDMVGNSIEWCNDWADDTYYSWSPSNSPFGPPSGTKKIVRGGYGLHTDANWFRSAKRGKLAPGSEFILGSFRTVRRLGTVNTVIPAPRLNRGQNNSATQSMSINSSLKYYDLLGRNIPAPLKSNYTNRVIFEVISDKNGLRPNRYLIMH